MRVIIASFFVNKIEPLLLSYMTFTGCMSLNVQSLNNLILWTRKSEMGWQNSTSPTSLSNLIKSKVHEKKEKDRETLFPAVKERKKHIWIKYFLGIHNSQKLVNKEFLTCTNASYKNEESIRCWKIYFWTFKKEFNSYPLHL